MDDDAANLVAERRLTCGAGEVVCKVFKPEPGDRDYRCRIEIAWPDRTKRTVGYGVDPIQALLLALQRLHVELLASPEGRAGELRWLDSEDLGLPLSANVSPEDFRNTDRD